MSSASNSQEPNKESCEPINGPETIDLETDSFIRALFYGLDSDGKLISSHNTQVERNSTTQPNWIPEDSNKAKNNNKEQPPNNVAEQRENNNEEQSDNINEKVLQNIEEVIPPTDDEEEPHYIPRKRRNSNTKMQKTSKFKSAALAGSSLTTFSLPSRTYTSSAINAAYNLDENTSDLLGSNQQHEENEIKIREEEESYELNSSSDEDDIRPKTSPFFLNNTAIEDDEDIELYNSDEDNQNISRESSVEKDTDEIATATVDNEEPAQVINDNSAEINSHISEEAITQRRVQIVSESREVIDLTNDIPLDTWNGEVESIAEVESIVKDNAQRINVETTASLQKNTITNNIDMIEINSSNIVSLETNVDIGGESFDKQNDSSNDVIMDELLSTQNNDSIDNAGVLQNDNNATANLETNAVVGPEYLETSDAGLIDRPPSTQNKDKVTDVDILQKNTSVGDEAESLEIQNDSSIEVILGKPPSPQNIGNVIDVGAQHNNSNNYTNLEAAFINDIPVVDNMIEEGEPFGKEAAFNINEGFSFDNLQSDDIDDADDAIIEASVDQGSTATKDYTDSNNWAKDLDTPLSSADEFFDIEHDTFEEEDILPATILPATYQQRMSNLDEFAAQSQVILGMLAQVEDLEGTQSHSILEYTSSLEGGIKEFANQERLYTPLTQIPTQIPVMEDTETDIQVDSAAVDVDSENEAMFTPSLRLITPPVALLISDSPPMEVNEANSRAINDIDLPSVSGYVEDEITAGDTVDMEIITMERSDQNLVEEQKAADELLLEEESIKNDVGLSKTQIQPGKDVDPTSTQGQSGSNTNGTSTQNQSENDVNIPCTQNRTELVRDEDILPWESDNEEPPFSSEPNQEMDKSEAFDQATGLTASQLFSNIPQIVSVPQTSSLEVSDQAVNNDTLIPTETPLTSQPVLSAVLSRLSGLFSQKSSSPIVEEETIMLESQPIESTQEEVEVQMSNEEDNEEEFSLLSDEEEDVFEDPMTQLESLPSFHEDTQNVIRKWHEQEEALVGVEIPNSIELIEDRMRNRTQRQDCMTENKLKMWWYDAFEEQKNAVHLYGKVYDHKHQKFTSCCVVVENIQREVYVLPRKFKLNESNEATHERVTFQDVVKEIEAKFHAKGIKSFKMRRCIRKYAFELPNVPSEAVYIKINYPFYEYQFPVGTSGQTFGYMFGNTADLLEMFLVQQKIMGPCWLEFEPVFDTISKESWCTIEGVIEDPKHCKVLKDDLDAIYQSPPPLNIMSLSLQVQINQSDQNKEILAASAFVCVDADIDSLESQPFRRFAITRLDEKYNQPRDTFEKAAQQKSKTNLQIYLENSEESLLYRLLVEFMRYDVDIVVGHDFSSATLDILLKRFKKFNTKHWSKIGRRRTDKFRKSQVESGGTGISSYHERLAMCGRLVCDTYTASKDLIKSKSYHLTELALAQLNIEREEFNIKEHQRSSQYFDIELAIHSSFDAYLAFALMAKLQILPLTKQLTNLSGNLWARSMNGARQERNEYLLLHTFYEKNYVCPDRPSKRKKSAILFSSEELELEQLNGKQSINAASSFKGGLVLEPKSGLYDKYVLLLDFNSLYPSIMQEFNVCFTTVDRKREGSPNYNSLDIPETPDPHLPLGILPNLVKLFVQRRQKVKKLLKESTLSKSVKQKYDIEQMSLKLTANSMYGCLGSSTSRFYARSLAMYVTAKGREILQSTVDLANEKNLDIIYGDTDSIMINTGKTKMYQAKAMGERFKKLVNKRYKVLEIDIDGYFRHTLLLRKKKYAALLVKEKPEGGLTESFEVKGLDLVRRDWCDLSHQISQEVLSLVLSDKPEQEVVDRIHLYLKDMDSKLQKVDLSDFIIRKQLTKPLHEYNKSKLQAHVQVAKEMRRSGISVKPGDTIPYVMSNTGPCMPKDIEQGKAELDLAWYKCKQILPPVNRLCDPIEGTDVHQLAECFDLSEQVIIDNHEFGLEKEDEEEQSAVMGSEATLLNDENRSAAIDVLVVQCPHCDSKNQLYDTDDLLSCHSCQTALEPSNIHIQSLLYIRLAISKYYQSLYVCKSLCGFSTKSISVLGDHCGTFGCQGRLEREFSSKMLYDSISYLSRLFDNNVQGLGSISEIVEQYLQASNYSYVDLHSLFDIEVEHDEEEEDVDEDVDMKEVV